MKCPNCGAEAGGKFCEFCGSQMQQENVTINITNNYYGEAANTPAEVPAPEVPKKKGAPTWVWVLGWICMFPLPLTILLLRKKDMKPSVKYTIIAVAWLLYFIIGFAGGEESKPQPETTQQVVTVEQERGAEQ